MTAKDPLYRLYRLDALDRITRAEILTAADDVDAVAQAKAAASGQAVELWDRGRFVIKLDLTKKEPWTAKARERSCRSFAFIIPRDWYGIR